MEYCILALSSGLLYLLAETDWVHVVKCIGVALYGLGSEQAVTLQFQWKPYKNGEAGRLANIDADVEDRKAILDCLTTATTRGGVQK